MRDETFLITEDFGNRPAIISNNNILVLNDKVIITLKNAFWATCDNSSSMLPTINHYTRSIEKKSENINAITMGDIVSYKKGNNIIIHRVISKGQGNLGAFLITKAIIIPSSIQKKCDSKKYMELLWR
ncbi:MAG: S26 family signal peptidase [Candidatus Woesearchaeota archaeon]